MSFTVMSPRSWKLSSTTGSFSIRFWWRIFSASSRVVPTGAVMSFSCVITSFTLRSFPRTKRRSRLVRMPTRRFPSVIGTPLIRNFSISSSARVIGTSGGSVIGFTIIPLSDRFTRSTSSTCSRTGRFLWMMPIPPSCAIAIVSATSSATRGERTPGSWPEVLSRGVAKVFIGLAGEPRVDALAEREPERDAEPDLVVRLGAAVPRRESILVVGEDVRVIPVHNHRDVLRHLPLHAHDSVDSQVDPAQPLKRHRVLGRAEILREDGPIVQPAAAAHVGTKHPSVLEFIAQAYREERHDGRHVKSRIVRVQAVPSPPDREVGRHVVGPGVAQ